MQASSLVYRYRHMFDVRSGTRVLTYENLCVVCERVCVNEVENSTPPHY